MKFKIILFIVISSILSIELVSQKRNHQPFNTSIFDNIEVRNIAPAKVSGRITKVLKDYSNSSIWYVTTASGNVWKTQNSGTTWIPIFDVYGSYSIGTISMDPNNPNVLWLGTGENNSQRSVGFGDVALTAYVPHDYPDGEEPGLDFASFYDPANFVYPFGAHICVVEVDKDTGEVDIVKYVAVDDCGNIINPMIVEGQIHGGIAQGIGQALYEGAVYDDSGQLLNGSLLDYTLPRADNLPMFETDNTVTPCPHNPLGVKGIGEAGTIGSTPAVVNAVVDALAGLGVKDIQMPLTPERVWKAMNSNGNA